MDATRLHHTASPRMVRLFPPSLRPPAFDRHLLKEFVECLALEWISRSAWAKHLTFIGGTCLRLARDIDRFSEDLDFDIKGLDSGAHPCVTDKVSLKQALAAKASSVDLERKRRDVVHLLFYRERAATILDFPAFVSAL